MRCRLQRWLLAVVTVGLACVGCASSSVVNQPPHSRSAGSEADSSRHCRVTLSKRGVHRYANVRVGASTQPFARVSVTMTFARDSVTRFALANSAGHATIPFTVGRAGSSSAEVPVRVDSSHNGRTTRCSTDLVDVPVRARLAHVEWNRVSYPDRCGRYGHITVLRHILYDFGDDGFPDAVVEVRCNFGAGTPPSALYVYDGRSSARHPELLATLLAATARPASHYFQTNTFSVYDDVVRTKAGGFTSRHVPSCCPDRSLHLEWVWRNGRFTRL